MLRRRATIFHVLRMAKGELIEIPAHWGLDDWPQYVQTFDLDYMMPIKAASLGMEVFREEFDAAYKYRAVARRVAPLRHRASRPLGQGR